MYRTFYYFDRRFIIATKYVFGCLLMLLFPLPDEKVFTRNFGRFFRSERVKVTSKLQGSLGNKLYIPWGVGFSQQHSSIPVSKL